MDANKRRNQASLEAADWLTLLESRDGMTRAEREAFIDWLRDSQTNIAEMLRLSQVHGALERFDGWGDITTDGTGSGGPENIVSLRSTDRGTDQQHPAGLRKATRGVSLLWLSAASVAVISIVIGILLVPQWRERSIITARGERREVVLDDGSQVKVDPETRLKVQFEKGVRRVRLSEGRAVFRVAKDPTRPFLVDASNTIVRAVGTAFGVEQRDSNVVVTVSEGKVAVSSPNLSQSNPDLSSSSLYPSHRMDRDAKGGVRRNGMRSAEDAIRQTGEVFLTANQQVTVDGSAPTEPVHEVNSSRELAWAEGRLVFKNEPMEKVVYEFNRYNRIQLKVLDPTLAQRAINGVFDAENPEAFIAFLQNAAAVRIERDEHSILITPQ